MDRNDYGIGSFGRCSPNFQPGRQLSHYQQRSYAGPTSEQETHCFDRAEEENARASAFRADSVHPTLTRLASYTAHDSRGANENQATHRSPTPEKQHSRPDPMSSSHRKKVRGFKNLRKKYDQLYEARENVLVGREQIQAEYQDLSWRLEEVRMSQEEIVNTLKEELHSPDPVRNMDLLSSWWDRTQSDHRTFQDRLSRIDELLNLQIQPEAEVIVADADFLDAAKKTMKSVEAAKRTAENAPAADGERAAQSEPDQPGLMPHESNLVQQLDLHKTNVRMYKERLGELEWDHDEDAFARELLYDRGDQPEIPEATFQSEYTFHHKSIERDIRQEQSSVQLLSAACASAGLQSAAPIREEASPLARMSNSYLSNVPEGETARDPEDMSDPFADDTEEMQNVPEGDDDPRRWSQTSFMNSMSSPKVSDIQQWVDKLKIKPERRLSTGSVTENGGQEAASSLRRAISCNSPVGMKGKEQANQHDTLQRFRNEHDIPFLHLKDEEPV